MNKRLANICRWESLTDLGILINEWLKSHKVSMTQVRRKQISKQDCLQLIYSFKLYLTFSSRIFHTNTYINYFKVELQIKFCRILPKTAPTFFVYTSHAFKFTNYIVYLFFNRNSHNQQSRNMNMIRWRLFHWFFTLAFMLSLLYPRNSDIFKKMLYQLKILKHWNNRKATK